MSMDEQRRHQRIRFGKSPLARVGFGGRRGKGLLVNLSLSGFMLRTDVPLEVGKTFGCEFSVSGPTKIDVAAVVVSRVGDMFGARFQAGPISDLLIRDAVDNALSTGLASVLSMHNQQGRRIMRIAGALNETLSGDFTYSLTKVGVDEFDLSAVTLIDDAGLELCRHAVATYGVSISAMSECFALAWDRKKK